MVFSPPPRLEPVETGPSGFLHDLGQMGSVLNRLVSLSSGSPRSPVLQLETRPASCGNQCISPGLESGKDLRVSPVFSDHEIFDLGKETTGGGGLGNSHLEISSLFSWSDGTFLPLFNLSPPLTESSSESRPSFLHQMVTESSLHLMIWWITGGTGRSQGFLNKLRSSCPRLGLTAQSNTTGHNGCVGVCDGVWILWALI